MLRHFISFIACVRCRGEYSAHWKCVQAGGMYFLVQFIKMLILATFFPETESENLDVVGVS